MLRSWRRLLIFVFCMACITGGTQLAPSPGGILLGSDAQAASHPRPATGIFAPWQRNGNDNDFRREALRRIIEEPAPLAPTAKLSANLVRGEAPLTVEFDASASSDPDGSIVQCKWKWDGIAESRWEFDSGASTHATHIYAEAGNYQAWVQITDDDGQAAMAELDIKVTSGDNLPPEAALVVNPQNGQTPLTVFFDASTSTDADGQIVSYLWDLDGDYMFEASSGSTPTTSNYYPSGDNMLIRVQVTDDDGDSDIAYAVAGMWDPIHAGDWYMINRDHQHNGQSIYLGPQQSTVNAYMFSVTAPVSSSPVIADNGDVFINCGHNLYRLDYTLHVKVTLTSANEFLFSPAIGQDGTIYICADGLGFEGFYALYPNLSVKWGIDNLQPTCSPVLSSTGNIYVCAIDDVNSYILVLDPNGNQIDKILTGCKDEQVIGTPAIADDGSICFGTTEGYVLWLDSNGSFKWGYGIGGTFPADGFVASPLIDDMNKVFIGSGKGFYAFDSNGKKMWEYMCGDVRTSALMTLDRIVIFRTATKLIGIDADYGTLEKPVPLSTTRSSPIMDSDQNIYMTSDDGYLSMYHHGAIPPVWQAIHALHPTDSTPAISDKGIVYVGAYMTVFGIY